MSSPRDQQIRGGSSTGSPSSPTSSRGRGRGQGSGRRPHSHSVSPNQGSRGIHLSYSSNSSSSSSSSSTQDRGERGGGFPRSHQDQEYKSTQTRNNQHSQQTNHQRPRYSDSFSNRSPHSSKRGSDSLNWRRPEEEASSDPPPKNHQHSSHRREHEQQNLMIHQHQQSLIGHHQQQHQDEKTESSTMNTNFRREGDRLSATLGGKPHSAPLVASDFGEHILRHNSPERVVRTLSDPSVPLPARLHSSDPLLETFEKSLERASESTITRQSSISSASRFFESHQKLARQRSGRPTLMRSTSLGQNNSPSSSRIIRVFICSCFKDMKKERNDLVQFVFPYLRSFCSRKGIFLSEVDLRWGITVEATGSDVVASCLREVQRSNYVICLIGERYGWIPPPQDLSAAMKLLNEEAQWIGEVGHDLSVTHLEILASLGNPPSVSGKRVLAYFRSAQYSSTLDEDAAVEIRKESDEAGEKVHLLMKGLRAIGCKLVGVPLHIQEGPSISEPSLPFDPEDSSALCSAQTNADASFFVEHCDGCKDHRRANPSSPCTLLYRDYEVPSSLPDLIVSDLINCILEDFPEDGVFEDPLHQERFEHLVFAERCVRTFIPFREGEEALEHALIEPLAPHEADESSPAKRQGIVLVGESGTGKSSLLAYLGYKLRENPENVVIMHFVGQTAYSTSVPNMLRRIIFELAEHFHIQRDLFSPKVESLSSSLIECFEYVAAKHPAQRIYILIDALNQIPGSSDPSFSLDWVPPLLPHNIHFIVSCTPRMAALPRLLARGLADIRMPNISVSEASQLAIKYLQHYGKELSSADLEKITLSKQCLNPLFLKLLLDELRLIGSFDDLASQIEFYSQLPDIIELNKAILKRLERYNHDELVREGRHFVDRFMSLLCVSRSGLAESELLAMLDLPHAPVIHLLSLTADSLVAQAGLLTFCHDSLRDAVLQVYLGDEKVRMASHSTLIRFFAQLPHDDPRRLHELPYQLMQQRDYDGLKILLSDLPTFHAMFQNEFSKLELYSYWRAVGVQHAAGCFWHSFDRFYQKAGHLSARELCRPLISMATALEELAQYEKAEEFFMQILHIMKAETDEYDLERDPADREVLCEVLEIFSTLHSHLAQYDKMEAALKRAQRMRVQINGPASIQVARILDELGWRNITSKNWDAAEELLTESFFIKTIAFHHFDSFLDVEVNLELSAWEDIVEKVIEALRFPTDGLEVEPTFARTINRLAVLNANRKSFALARKLYNWSLQIQKLTYGAGHPYIATVYGDVGRCIFDEWKANQNPMLLSDALSHLRSALEIRRTTLGDQHPFYATSLFNLALSLHEANASDLEGVESMMKEALEIRTNCLGRDNPQTKAVLRRLKLLSMPKKEKSSSSASRERPVITLSKKKSEPSSPAP